MAFCVPFIGTYSWLSFKKASIKKEVKRELIRSVDASSLVKLGFKLSEIDTKLRWEHSKEFEFEGQMYDIVSQRTKEDSVFYLCWPDHEETTVNKKLRKLVSENFSNDKASRDKQQRLKDFSSNLFPPYVSNYFYNNSNSEKYLIRINIYYTSIINEPPLPPPRIS